MALEMKMNVDGRRAAEWSEPCCQEHRAVVTYDEDVVAGCVQITVRRGGLRASRVVTRRRLLCERDADRRVIDELVAELDRAENGPAPRPGMTDVLEREALRYSERFGEPPPLWWREGYGWRTYRHRGTGDRARVLTRGVESITLGWFHGGKWTGLFRDFWTQFQPAGCPLCGADNGELHHDPCPEARGADPITLERRVGANVRAANRAFVQWTLRHPPRAVLSRGMRQGPAWDRFCRLLAGRLETLNAQTAPDALTPEDCAACALDACA